MSKVLPQLFADILCCESHGIPCGDWLILPAFSVMAAVLDVNKAEVLIQSVVESNSLPDFWNPNVDKANYILNKLFDFIEKKSFSTAVVKPSITLLCRILIQ